MWAPAAPDQIQNCPCLSCPVLRVSCGYAPLMNSEEWTWRLGRGQNIKGMSSDQTIRL